MNRYAVAAVLSGAFFGLTGLFTRTLTGAGLSTMGILTIRCSVAALCFFCSALGDIRRLKMHKKDFWLFAAVGILGQGMFSFCYYNAINMMSISTACILMYLSPVFVTIMAHFVFKDGISRRTVLAIILCIAGCACVSGFGGTVTLLGFVCGLGSAIAFALIKSLTRAVLGRAFPCLDGSCRMCVCGVFVIHEPFGVLCVVGIVLVLAGIVLQNTASKSESAAQ